MRVVQSVPEAEPAARVNVSRASDVSPRTYKQSRSQFIAFACVQACCTCGGRAPHAWSAWELAPKIVNTHRSSRSRSNVMVPFDCSVSSGGPFVRPDFYEALHSRSRFVFVFLESTMHTNRHEHVGGVRRFRQGHTCCLRVRLVTPGLPPSSSA